MRAHLRVFGVVRVSLYFYWDRGLNRLLCIRSALGIKDYHRNERIYLFTFGSVEDLVAVLYKEDKERVVYDEDGHAWTIDLLRKDIIERGMIAICPWSWSGERGVVNGS